jgi:hypothetical protein
MPGWMSETSTRNLSELGRARALGLGLRRMRCKGRWLRSCGGMQSPFTSTRRTNVRHSRVRARGGQDACDRRSGRLRCSVGIRYVTPSGVHGLCNLRQISVNFWQIRGFAGAGRIKSLAAPPPRTQPSSSPSPLFFIAPSNLYTSHLCLNTSSHADLRQDPYWQEYVPPSNSALFLLLRF